MPIDFEIIMPSNDLQGPNQTSTNTEDNPKSVDDPVNHPSHYTQGKIEVIDFIEDKKLPFHLANVVKYVARAGHKDPTKEVEDLEKARWYLDRYITLKKEENKNG